MSGFSASTKCPNCGNSADEYTGYKPFNYTSITCIHCGLMINPSINYMNLKELNDYRRQQGVVLLKKKPKQDKDLW